MRRAWGDRALGRVSVYAVVVAVGSVVSAAPLPGPMLAGEIQQATAQGTAQESAQEVGASGAIEALPLGMAAERAEPGLSEDSREVGGETAPFGLAEALRTLAALAFVLVLAVGGAAALRKVAKGRGGLLGALGPGGPSPSGVLEILGRYPVGSGQTLVLLRLDRRVLLLHQTTSRKGASMRTLAEVAEADEVASILMKTREEETERVNTGFREAMRKLETDFTLFEAESRPAHQTSPGPSGGDEGHDSESIRSRLSRWTTPAAMPGTAGNSL